MHRETEPENKNIERSVELLNFALDKVHEAAFLIDKDARFRYVNDESCRTLGFSREELLVLGIADIDPDFPIERWPGHWDELIKRGSITFEGRHRTKDGRVFPVEISASYFELDGQGYDLALVRDITERIRVEDALRFIAQRGWAGTADSFLSALAGYLADTLGMDYVLIAHLLDDGCGMAETSALYAKGEILPNIRYELKGTPCENVIGKNLCLYPEGIQALFPADTLLADMGAESYAGIPLWDSAGRPIGLLAALDGKPFHDESTLSYILQLAATSAAAALERERMENGLRESEERFRTLTEKSPVGVYIIQDDLFRYVNPAFAEIHGYGPEDIIDRLGPLDFLTPEDRERVLVNVRPEIEFYHDEFHISRRDGSIRVVEVFGSLASNQGRPAIIGTIVDITERKRSEEQIFQVTERWKRTFDAVPDLIAIIDTDFRIVQVNRAMAERLGAAPTECIGHVCYEAIHKTEGPPSYCPHVQTLEDCHEHRAEVSEECLGGDFIVTTSPIYDSVGQLMGSVHVARDITERKHAETKLNEQLHFLQQLLDSIPIPVFYKDVDGLYLGCNSAFERFIGLSRNKIVGKTVYEVSQKERADKYHEADAALLRKPGVQLYEEIVIYNDGECHNVIFNKATFFDANNCVSGIVGAMIDITSLRKAEEERKKLEAQLHQAQKMEAIGLLAGGIAHDFNNILTAIMGYAEMDLLKMEKGNPFRRHLEQISASSKRAAELTNCLLAFSRRQVLHAKPLDLCGIVLGLEKMMGRLVPEDIAFRTTVAEGNLVVMADKVQIEQVLMNLVTNAKDAMPMGGTITIEVSPAVMEAGFVHAHGFGEPGDYACVTVSDTGCGMDEETRKRIFEPFFTTKEVGKGTGLGMSIIYGIIQQHKGYISIYSEKGIGTTFKIYLPLMTEEIGVANESSEAKPSPGGAETVLLAEDDESVLELHRIILDEAGYRVIEAVDGRDALDKFKEHRTEVDILATDVIMPRMNGKILYEEVSKIRPDMKVLFMSGYTKDIIVERGILEDEFTVITKPVTAHELLRKVREILDLNISR